MSTLHSSISCNDNPKDLALLLLTCFRISITWPCFSSAHTEKNYAFSSHIPKSHDSGAKGGREISKVVRSEVWGSL